MSRAITLGADHPLVLSLRLSPETLAKIEQIERSIAFAMADSKGPFAKPVAGYSEQVPA